MLLLLFQLGENLYAIDTAEIIQIAPMALLAKVPAAPDHIAGVLNYRNSIVPVIDLCHLIRGTPCQVCYSTRIVIVNYSAANSIENFDRNSTSKQLGLMAERVTKTLKVDETRFKTAKQISNISYLGEIFIDKKNMIQQVYWQHLISEVQQTVLFAEGRNQANGAEHH